MPSATSAGNLVTAVLYNQLGQVTEINLGNGLRTTYGYWGTGGGYDTSGGYYGRLWEIKTLPQAGGNSLQDVRHTWDAGGNLVTRNNILSSDAENFSYDFLDRLTWVSGNYTQSYDYNAIGNILSMNGVSYSYGSKPHAVTSVGATSYTYDANGNMLTRGSGNITWDVENRPISITTGNSTATFVYDGDGNRVKKSEGGQTFLYVNKLYEKNLTTGNVTTSYYLAGRLIAQREGSVLRYVHQDHLTGTSVMSDSSGALISSIFYAPFGTTRGGSVATDIKFTGQRLDGTGLYYYGARYYDPAIGRFISADTFVQTSTDFNSVSSTLTVNVIPQGLGSQPALQGFYPLSSVSTPPNPQALNRYSYVLSNPLRYNDPFGWWTFGLHLSLGFNLAFSVNIGMSLLWDTYGNWALTKDSPDLSISTTKSAGTNVGFSTTSKDTIYDLLNETTYIVGIEGGEIIRGNPQVIFDNNGPIGIKVSGGLGIQWPALGLTVGVSNPNDIIGSNEMFQNYSFQQFIYDMLNIFVSSDAAYYFDYFYDYTMNYGYNYDQYY